MKFKTVLILLIFLVLPLSTHAEIKWTNNASSTISDVGGIAAGDTSMTVDTGEGDLFPAVTAPHYFMVTLVDASGNREIVKVTARASGSDTFTIDRAEEGTIARAFAQGSAVELRVTAGSLDEFSKAAAVDSNVYLVDSSEADQGIAGAGESFRDLLTSIGTSKKATIVFPHDGSGNTTTFTFSTSLDASTYTNISVIFAPGAITSYGGGVTVTWPKSGKVPSNGNDYTWDAEATKWRVESGNQYTTVLLPTTATYTIETGTLVFDTTTLQVKRYSGTAWIPATGSILRSQVFN